MAGVFIYGETRAYNYLLVMLATARKRFNRFWSGIDIFCFRWNAFYNTHYQRGKCFFESRFQRGIFKLRDEEATQDERECECGERP